MHTIHGRTVLDALPLKIGTKIVLPSGRTGIVWEIGRSHILFLYADAPKALTIRQFDNWSTSLPRKLVAKLLDLQL